MAERLRVFGNDIVSESLGYVTWTMSEATFSGKPCRLLRSEGYDKKTGTLDVEEVWTDESGERHCALR